MLVLTLYFLASLRTMKLALERLAPAHAREQLAEIIDQITESVGGYVSGMAILAFCNAVFAFILLSILRVPFAALLAFLALLITMIPLIGPVLFWLLATGVIMFTSPWSALVFAVVYFAYMQVEAYVMTPRVMNKAVDIPGSLVLIGAMVGGTAAGPARRAGRRPGDRIAADDRRHRLHPQAGREAATLLSAYGGLQPALPGHVA